MYLKCVRAQQRAMHQKTSSPYDNRINTLNRVISQAVACAPFTRELVSHFREPITHESFVSELSVNRLFNNRL